MNVIKSSILFFVLLSPLGAYSSKDYSPEYTACVKKAEAAPNSNSQFEAESSCASEENARWDKRLNAAYKALKAKLPLAQFVVLRDGERKWMAHRDAQCKPEDDGTLSVLASQTCILNLTVARTKELEGKVGR